MKRLQFLKILLSLPFGVHWLAKKLQAGGLDRKQLLNKFYVAGFQYYGGPSLIENIKPGEELQLAADPDNYYDKFAVAIYRKGLMLGHVPRSDNKHISRLLQQDINLYCTVIEANPNRETREMLKVEVGL